MANILIAGFQPFGEWTYNPSAQIVSVLGGSDGEGYHTTAVLLPVVFGEDFRILQPLLDDLKPAVLLCLGLASGATSIQVERFAVNLRANRGENPVPIDPQGPAAIITTIPVERVADAIRAAGAPAGPHCYAGDYLCNHVLYRALAHLSAYAPEARCGFLHLPHSTEGLLQHKRVDLPGLPLELMVAGVRAAIGACLD